MSELAEKIKFYRKQKNLNQEDLAKILNVSRVTITRYENGTREPNLEVLNKIAYALEIPIEYLTGLSYPKKYFKSIRRNDFDKIFYLYIPEIINYLKSIFNLTNYDNADDFFSSTTYEIEMVLSESLNFGFYSDIYAKCYYEIEIYGEDINLDEIFNIIDNLTIKDKIKGILLKDIIFVIDAKDELLKKETNKSSNVHSDYKNSPIFFIDELTNDLYESMRNNIVENILSEIIKNLSNRLNILGRNNLFEYEKKLLQDDIYHITDYYEKEENPWQN